MIATSLRVIHLFLFFEVFVHLLTNSAKSQQDYRNIGHPSDNIRIPDYPTGTSIFELPKLQMNYDTWGVIVNCAFHRGNVLKLLSNYIPKVIKYKSSTLNLPLSLLLSMIFVSHIPMIL